MDVLSRQAFDDSWQALDVYLSLIEQRGNLAAALFALHEHQVQSGFIRDELTELRRFILRHPDRPERFFSAQYNPARSRRFQGAGRAPNAEPEQSVNNGCFLCADNIWWQQQGTESGYHLHALNGRYTAWMNPFPLVAGHAVIASREHLPQHWRTPGGPDLDTLVSDLVDLTALLPGWLNFYNGLGAGASIPHHLHLHALPRSKGYESLPLESAARQGSASGQAEHGYPLSFLHWYGEPESVKAQALGWVQRWQHGAGADDDATANIIASQAAGRLDLYFIPRHQRRSRAEGLGGVIGGFEALGEIVCSSDEELEKLQSGSVDYFTIEGMLAQVSVAL